MPLNKNTTYLGGKQPAALPPCPPPSAFNVVMQKYETTIVCTKGSSAKIYNRFVQFVQKLSEFFL